MKILIPSSPTDMQDIETRKKILDKNLDEKIERGLELYLKLYHLEDYKKTKKEAKENLKMMEGYTLTMHAPLPPYENLRQLIALNTEEGKEMFKKILEIAHEVNVGKINAHTNIFISSDDKRYQSLTYRNEVIEKMKENIAEIEKHIPIAIENMPTPAFADSDAVLVDGKRPYDPMCNTLEDMLLYEKITLDTAHYQITKMTIDRLYRKHGELTRKVLEKEQLFGLYPESFGKQPVILKAMKKLGKKLIHMHLADTEGLWVPGESVVKEGCLLGNGDVGWKQFKAIIKYLKNTDMTATLEIKHENFDYGFEESLRRVNRALVR